MLYTFLSRLSNYNVETLISNQDSLEGWGTIEISLKNRDMYETGIELGMDLQADREKYLSELENTKTGVYILELEGGFLNCPQPLIPNTEVKFTFERLPATYSLFYSDTKTTLPTSLNGKVVQITDCYLELEYVTSPYLRNLNASIVEKPITYHYDDYQIYLKDLAKGAQTFRVNSLCGGLTPEYIFAGFMPAKSFDPDFMTTSVVFQNPGIREACMTLNGAPVQGYPITMFLPNHKEQLYSRFLDTIGKSKKTASGGTISLDTFGTDFCLISHHFEGENTNEGWIGFDVKFNKPTEEDYTFGKTILQ